MDDQSPDHRYARRRTRPKIHRAQRARPHHAHLRKRRAYLPVRGKFTVAVASSFLWFVICAFLALPWMRDLARLTNWPVSLLVIGGIALVPGFMNAFLAISIVIDRRPPRRLFDRYPRVSILIAAYNEADVIGRTLRSIALQDYPGEFEAIVIDDCSTDDTVRVVESQHYRWLRLLRQPVNLAKSAALNRGLHGPGF